jgi:hypothetical protein
MSHHCLPRWTTAALSELYLANLADESSQSQVYIESLDGIHDAQHIAQLLLSWGIKLENPTLPIMNKPNQLLRLIKDDRYFPGYDTVWLLRPNSKPFSSPTFITWYATEEANALVKDKATGRPVPWSVVSDWMFSVGSWVGISGGVLRLEVSLIQDY